MPRGPETRETKRIIDDIKAKYPDAFVQKISAATPFVRRGLPDIYACIDGVSWWFEVKIHPNRPSPAQEHCIEAMTAAGCNVAVLTIRLDEAPSRWDMYVMLSKNYQVNTSGRPIGRYRGERWPIEYIVGREG